MKVLLPATLLSLLPLLSLPQAQAKNAFYPTRFSQKTFALTLLEQGPQAADKMLYYGGPVIPNARVTAVLWGMSVDSGVKSRISGFYEAVVKSDLMTWMDQYNTSGKALDGRDGTNQHIGLGSYTGLVTIQPAKTSGTIDDTEIQLELQKQIDAGVLPKTDENSLFMLYFPPGMTITIAGMSSCAQFCGYHGFKGTPQTDGRFFYSVMPDLGGACSFSCGFGDRFDNMTSISSHELCEAVTDPFPTPGSDPAYPQAWNDARGAEIGDLCQGNNILSSSGGKSYTVQAEFDNSTGSCTSRSWSAP